MLYIDKFYIYGILGIGTYVRKKEESTMDEFYKYVLLSLVSEMEGERGKAFFVSLLRGSKQKKVLYVLNKKAIWGYYNLLGLLSRSSVDAMYDELIDEGMLHIKHKRLTDGFLYPLIYMDEVAAEYLKARDNEFGSRLKELFESNIRIIDMSRSVLDLSCQTDTLPEVG